MQLLYTVLYYCHEASSLKQAVADAVWLPPRAWDPWLLFVWEDCMTSLAKKAAGETV